MALLPMYPGKVNSPVTELVSDIDEVQDTIEVSDGSALPDAPNIAVIGSGEDAETIQYGTKTGNVLSDVVRGFQGVAKAWSAGQKVARNFTAYDYDALRQNLESHGSEHNHDGSDPIPDLVQLRDDLNDIKTPDPSYTPDRPIDKPGDMTRDLQARVMTHLDEKAQDDVHDLLSDGKIIEESGQNENGRYVRFADGTQICWKDNVVTYTSESPDWKELGTLYRSSGVTVVYPASFSSTPVLIPRIRRTGGNIYPWPGPQTGAGTSQADMYFISHSSSAPDAVAGYVAVGRWK